MTGGSDSDGTTQAALDRGREAFAARRWRDAFTELSAANADGSLEPEHLDLLATAAYLIGEEVEATAVWTRAHHGFVDQGALRRAARCGFWLSMTLLLRGEGAQGAGWLARAERLLEDADGECAEKGLLLVLRALMSLLRGDADGACAGFEQATELGERSGDADLLALGLLGRGQARVARRELADGVASLDEAMVGVTAGQVSPIVAGIVYCAVILECHAIFDLRRAQEWTAALARWCGEQPDMVSFRGTCLVHRSEILQLHGDWPTAAEEAQRACERISDSAQVGGGIAFYQRAELHRLCGELERAEQLYREASERGYEPQPGMSLLRLAQGDLGAAEAAIRRVAGEVSGPARASVLGPYVEIVLASGDVAAARRAVDELAEIAEAFDAPWLRAVCAQATGAVLLAEREPAGALTALRDAWTRWQQLDGPYEAARCRALIARACRELGDADTARTHLDAARTTFERLGARLDLAALEGPARAEAPSEPSPSGLTGREREVLGLVAAGRTNRAIAAALHISEHTVARHLSNIFTKLGVSSRTAASAFAYEHGLVGRPDGPN